MDVGGMLQVREVAICRAVRHVGDVTQNGVKLSLALGFQWYLAELLINRRWEERDGIVLLMRGFWAEYAVANLWPGRSSTACCGRWSRTGNSDRS
jgi:hypothetical protein